MQNFTKKTIHEIAVEVPATTRVFAEFKIDVCSGGSGSRRFSEACLAAGVSPEAVRHRIDEVLTAENRKETSWKRKSVSELIDYILEKHHAYTRRELVRLTDLMEKVRRKHGDRNPELYFLENELFALADDFTAHMRKEETVLFPFIKLLETAVEYHLQELPATFDTVKNPVRMMMIEHDSEGEMLRRMRELTHDYIVPEKENSCPSFRELYNGLSELEMNLHRHIYLENNVLFPQAVKLEQKVLFGY